MTKFNVVLNEYKSLSKYVKQFINLMLTGLSALGLLFILRENISFLHKFFSHLVIVILHIIFAIGLDLLQKEAVRKKSLIKIGVAFYVEDKAPVKEIRRLVSPILRQLSAECKNIISFKLIAADTFRSVNDGIDIFLTNKCQVENLILFQIKSEKSKGRGSRLVIKESGFLFKTGSNNITLQGVKFNLAKGLNMKEIAYGIKFIGIEPTKAKQQIEHQIRGTILYFTGVFCLAKHKYHAALHILRAIYTNRETGRTSECSEKLKIIISKVYSQTCFQFCKDKEPQKGLSICQDALKILGDSPAACIILCQMAILSYKIGNFSDARTFTKQMVTTYAKTRACKLTGMVANLKDFENKSASTQLIIDCATSILNFCCMDEAGSKIKLGQLRTELSTDPSYSKMQKYIEKLLSEGKRPIQ